MNFIWKVVEQSLVRNVCFYINFIQQCLIFVPSVLIPKPCSRYCPPSPPSCCILKVCSKSLFIVIKSWCLCEVDYLHVFMTGTVASQPQFLVFKFPCKFERFRWLSVQNVFAYMHFSQNQMKSTITVIYWGLNSFF